MSRIFSYVGRAVVTCALVLVACSLMTHQLTATVVAHATPDNPLFSSALRSLAILGAAKGTGLAMFGPLLHLKAKSYADLIADSKPPTADEPEFFPMTWFDSTTYTSATTVGSVNLFSATNADQSLSNMQLAGQFPAGEYFDLGEIHCDILARTLMATTPAAASVLPGYLDDLQQILNTSRTTVQLNWRNKAYGPWPLSIFRPLGSVRGTLSGTYAAATAAGYGGNDGVGCMFEKTLTIAPTSKFGLTVNFPTTALTLTGNAVLRFTLRGVHYRTVN